MAIIFLDDDVVDMGEEHFGFSKYVLNPCVPIFLFKGCIKNCLQCMHYTLRFLLGYSARLFTWSQITDFQESEP